MVIKVNYNYVAALLGVLAVGAFCIVELLLPPNIQTNAEVKEETITLPVSMYHHFLKNPSRHGTYVISPQKFEEDLQYIKKCGYTTILTEELLDHIKNGAELPEKPMMITIDDGNESVYEYVFPLLKKYHMKAVVNIIGKRTDFFSDPNEDKNLNYANLSWDQLREMQKSGLFEIGNHTYDMHSNGKKGIRYGISKKRGESFEQYKQALWDDIGVLNDKMEKELGEYPTVFAYPFGTFSKDSRIILADMGFRVIFTCEEKINVIDSDTLEPIILKRFNRPHCYSTEKYFKKLGIVSQ